MAIGLPQMIVDMTCSTEPQMKIREECVVEKMKTVAYVEGSLSSSLSPKDL